MKLKMKSLICMLLLYVGCTTFIGFSLSSMELLRKNSIIIYYMLIVLFIATVLFVDHYKNSIKNEEKHNNRYNNINRTDVVENEDTLGYKFLCNKSSNQFVENYDKNR